MIAARAWTRGGRAPTLAVRPIPGEGAVRVLGILLAILVAYLPMVLTLCGCTYYKVFYDARESSVQDVTHAGAFVIMLQLLPGVGPATFEIVVPTATR